MVAPIDYSLPGVQSPGTGFLQAAQVGANIAQVQAQREAMRAKADEALREQQRQDMVNRRIAEIRAKPNRTIDDYAEVAPYMNQAQLSFLTQQFKSQSEIKQQNDLLFLGETLSALRAKKPEVAIARLRTQADAEEATNPQAAKAYRNGALLAESDPASAELIVGPLLYRLPGADKVLENIKKTEGEAPGRTISTPADKIKAGLIDDRGNPLPGTFFEQPGKKPELVSGEKPKAGFKVLTTEEAKARNLPTQGFTWQIEEATGKIESLVKPPQAAVQVTLPGAPTVEKEEQKAKGVFNVEQYKGLVTTANVATRVLPALAAQEKLLAQGFQTGFGTQAKKVGASVLSAMGVPEAENFAANAETFFAAMNTAVLQKQLDQKGPQTEADAQRITATGAQLGNTVRGNQFIIALAKAQLKRDVEKRRFWENHWRSRKTYEGAEEAWEAGPGAASIFEAPELKSFLDVVPAQTRPAAPASPVAPAAPAAEGAFRIRSVRPSGG